MAPSTNPGISTRSQTFGEGSLSKAAFVSRTKVRLVPVGATTDKLLRRAGRDAVATGRHAPEIHEKLLNCRLALPCGGGMRKPLSSIFIAAGLSVAGGEFALAADLAAGPPQLYAPPLPAVYSWTGFYVGGNVGYGWGDASTDFAANGNVSSTPGVFGVAFPSNFGFADSNTAQVNGVIGGGQFGFNYQLNPTWVLGIEADMDSGQRGSVQSTDAFTTQICTSSLSPGVCSGTTPLNGTALTSNQATIDWFGTVRGRVGFLATDQLLIYGTGGLAFGKVAELGNTNLSAVPFTPNSAAFGASRTNVGFSVGAGMEGRFSYLLPPSLTWKVEYLYLDLGSLDTTTPFALAPPLVNPNGLSPATGTIASHTQFSDNILRLGLNYKFGN